MPADPAPLPPHHPEAAGTLRSALGELARDPALLAILGIAIVLRLPGLTESLWFDELWSTRVMLGSPREAFWVAITDAHPPLYGILMFGWIRVFGDGELSVRTIPMLAGLGAVVAAHTGFRPILGRPAATLTALLLALSPTQVWYSQEARSYSLLALLVLLAWLAWRRIGSAGPGHRRWLAYALLTGAATLTHFYALAFGAMQCLLALRWDSPRRRAVWWTNAVAVGLLAGFLGLRLAVAGPPLTENWYLRPFTPLELWMAVTNWLPTGDAIWRLNLWREGVAALLDRPAMLATQLAIAGLTVMGAARLVRRPESRDLVAMAAALPVMLGVLAVASGGNNYIERALLPAAPFLAALWAAGVDGIRWPAPRLAAWVASVAVPAAALVGYFQKAEEWTVYKPNVDWRSVASYLDAEPIAADSHGILLVTAPALELVYYGGARFEAPGRSAPAERPAAGASPAQGPWRIVPLGRLSAAERCAALEAPGVARRLLLVNQFSNDGMDEVAVEVARTCGHARAEVARFKGMVVESLTKR